MAICKRWGGIQEPRALCCVFSVLQPHSLSGPQSCPSGGQGPSAYPWQGAARRAPGGSPAGGVTSRLSACSSVGSLASFLLSQEQRHLSPRVWDAGRSLPLTNWSQSCSRGSPHVSCPPWPRTWLLPGAGGGKDGQKWMLRQERESDLALGILLYRASLLCLGL